jgi:hypothetical protein
MKPVDLTTARTWFLVFDGLNDAGAGLGPAM